MARKSTDSEQNMARTRNGLWAGTGFLAMWTGVEAQTQGGSTVHGPMGRYNFDNPHTVTIVEVTGSGRETAKSDAATLKGTVFDARTGEPLANAMVAVRSQQRVTITDAQGHFELTQISPGQLLGPNRCHFGRADARWRPGSILQAC
jgi:hypothetical protein